MRYVSNQVSLLILLIGLFLLIAGCSGVPRHDRMMCAVEYNGKCLQWNTFQSLRSLQQARIKP